MLGPLPIRFGALKTGGLVRICRIPATNLPLGRLAKANQGVDPMFTPARYVRADEQYDHAYAPPQSTNT
jgi:hypothetical protein